MAETELASGTANALSGTTDSTLDFTWPTIAESPYYTTWYRMFALWKRILEQNPDALRVYKDGDLTFGVKPGKYFNGDSVVSYTEETAQALTDNSTNYIYLTAAGVLTVNTTGFPAAYTTAHIPLATILTASGVYDHTDITNYRDTAIVQVARGAGSVKITSLIPGDWKIDADFSHGGLAGLDNTGDLTQTEAAAAYAQVYNHDDTSYQSLATSATNGAYTANYQIFPDADAENDAVYFGHTVPFCQMWMDMDTAATHVGDGITWEYWNGAAWSALTIVYDYTDSTAQDGLRPFQRDGAINWIPPANWAAVSVNSQSAYWVRARCNAATDTNAATTNSVEHKVCSPTDGIRAPCHCQITNVALRDQASTLHTTNDVKFIVMNFTKGTHSGELTFAQDKRSDAWGSITMECDRGDELWVLVTQEDETNEVSNGVLEMDATVL